MHITFYSKNNCSLCEKGLHVIEKLKEEYFLTVNVVDIYEDDELLEKYMLRIPVVLVEGIEADEGILSYDKISQIIKNTN
ncbi:glutaredoxin family protein [Alkalicoccobacillus murimartini]|uniref:Thiol-disulfide isomerase/thioredoxin n=1 Tax=Alkalicoccobacillus murimartini TaxID=171685 RepID=A0ABT9YG54_9BACI|nr:glutaredoxin family protein [Alkalicoccobacillus murimartini]MDQ0206694.1 thiol-disulfide isomerase/thioredoxin [Alkalicoccobacillus murimartini]